MIRRIGFQGSNVSPAAQGIVSRGSSSHSQTFPDIWWMPLGVAPLEKASTGTVRPMPVAQRLARRVEQVTPREAVAVAA